MELKEYFQIIKNNARLFWMVIIIIVAGSFLYFYLRPVSYETSLALNITRSGSQETDDYKFDGFYRLQADEKFAETIVQWLKMPGFVRDIYENAGLGAQKLTLRKLSRVFRAEKISAQSVLVSFSSENPETARKISDSILKVISKNIDNLNKDQKESNWFKVTAEGPLTIKDEINVTTVLVVSLFVGCFLAFWVVLTIHYFK